MNHGINYKLDFTGNENYHYNPQYLDWTATRSNSISVRFQSDDSVSQSGVELLARCAALPIRTTTTSTTTSSTTSTTSTTSTSTTEIETGPENSTALVTTDSPLSDAQCPNVLDGDKLDCGYFGVTQDSCEASNCCWAESMTAGTPWCFNKIAIISTNGPYENHEEWTVEHTCPSDKQVEFKLTRLNIETNYDFLLVGYGNTTLGKGLANWT